MRRYGKQMLYPVKRGERRKRATALRTLATVCASYGITSQDGLSAS
jgi:intergrase/recombinase